MCGLVAVIPKSTTRGFLKPELDMFETLVTVDSLRGMDSTGIFGIDDNDLFIAKDTLTGSEFLKTKEYADIQVKAFKRGKFLVAHNRAATRGNITDKNAHPFWKDNKVVMVHNGTFRGDHKKHADTEVDSEALCHLLASHEPNEIDKVLNKIDAAYAVMWFDTRDGTLNIVRNNDRPLFMLETTTAYIFSSEYLMVQFAAYRTGINIPKDGKPEQVPEHTHLKFDFSSHTLKLEKTALNILENDYSQYYNKNAVAYYTSPKVNNVVNITKEVIEQAQQSQSPFRHTSFVDVVDKDYLSTGKAQSYIEYKDFGSYREQYKPQSEAYFTIDHVVPLEDKSAVIYGRCTLDNGITVLSHISENDFVKIVDHRKKTLYAKGKVDLVTFKNKTAHINHDMWTGPVFVTVKDVVPMEGSVCAC